VYLRLLQHHRFPDEHGRLILYYFGDVINVKNKDLAARLIKEKKAVDLETEAKGLPNGMGVLVRHEAIIPPWLRALDVQIATGDIGLPFAYTLLWDGRVMPRQEMLVTTFEMLARTGWEVAVPLYSYHRLATAVGTEGDRANTKALIHDLRVPVYRTELIFVERNERTEKLMETWKAETDRGGEERLAFSRAAYMVKPYLLPLPCMWIVKR